MFNYYHLNFFKDGSIGDGPQPLPSQKTEPNFKKMPTIDERSNGVVVAPTYPPPPIYPPGLFPPPPAPKAPPVLPKAPPAPFKTPPPAPFKTPQPRPPPRPEYKTLPRPPPPPPTYPPPELAGWKNRELQMILDKPFPKQSSILFNYVTDFPKL